MDNDIVMFYTPYPEDELQMDFSTLVTLMGLTNQPVELDLSVPGDDYIDIQPTLVELFGENPENYPANAEGEALYVFLEQQQAQAEADYARYLMFTDPAAYEQYLVEMAALTGG